MAWHKRLLNLLRPGRLRREIERETAFHIAERVDDLMAAGMSREAAERTARRQFGNVLIQQERTRDVDVVLWLESLLADVRYALRGLRRGPGFALVAILSLGLGIGATTAVFSLMNALMLRSLPLPRPEQLVQVLIGERQPSFTNPLWEAIERASPLAGVLAYGGASFDLANGGESRFVAGNFVSGSYFNVLGLRPVAGRLLGPADDVRGCGGVAVLGHGFWRREYGGSPDAVGRVISLNGHPFEIVGVVDPAFSGLEVGENAQVFVPLCAQAILAGPDVLEHRGRWYLRIVGRLGADQSLEQANARMAAMASQVLAVTVPEHWSVENQQQYRRQTLRLRPAVHGLSALREQYRSALFVLLAVVGTVLLIACANIANLLLARAANRQHEMAIRRAIGSGRGRLIRQLVTESLLLSLFGTVLGLAMAPLASRLIVALISSGDSTIFLDLSLDARVLAFTIGVATLTGLGFGLAPAVRSTGVAAGAALRTGRSRAQRGGGLAAGKALVVGQLALSLLLVMTAGLLQGSFRRLVTLDPGFDRDGVLVVQANLSKAGYPENALRSVERGIVERLGQLPGVRSASASLVTPPGNMTWNDDVSVDGHEPASPTDRLVYMNTVSGDYFATMGTALLAGRSFNALDTEGSARVAVINRTMAERFFGEPAPVGRVFRILAASGPGAAFEVVGVVENSKYASLTEPDLPQAFFPLSQGALFGTLIDFQLRAEGDPASLIAGVKSAIADVSPAISLGFTTLEAHVSRTLLQPRLLAALSLFFGAMALLLAVIGLYGTINYAVTRRRAELSMRLALGATPAGVLRMILREIARLVLAGVALGILGAFASVRLLTAFLYGVTPSDPLTWTASTALLVLVALAAGAVPAWKAARQDPMLILREE